MTTPNGRVGNEIAWLGTSRPQRVVHVGRWVRVEPLAIEHVPALYDACHGPQVEPGFWDYLPYGPFASQREVADWVATGARQDDPVFFAICRPDGQAAGVASYLRIDEIGGVIEIGHIWLCPIIQRSRAATEAIYLLMKHALEDLHYRRLEWKCDALNQRSRHAAMRYGFTFEGVFRQAAVVKSRNRDTAWFSIIDREWPVVGTALRRWLTEENFGEHGEQRRSLAALRATTTTHSIRAAGVPVRGSCLCGRVVFEITGGFRRANYCHCSRCRKHSGGATSAQGRIAREHFRLLSGAEAISTFTPPNGMVKAFCSHCGSSLFGGTWPDGPEISVRLGTLDDDPGIRPQYHSFIGSKAEWEDLPEDGLPRFAGRPARPWA